MGEIRDPVLLRPPKGLADRTVAVPEAEDGRVVMGDDGLARVTREVASILLRRNEGWHVVREPIPIGELARMRERLAFLERRALDLGAEMKSAGEQEGHLVVDLETLRADMVEGRATAQRVVKAAEAVEQARSLRQQIGAAIDVVKREHEQLSLRIAAEERVRRALDPP